MSKNNDYVTACILSNLGVILPVVALEISKLISFRGKERIVYSFDIIGVVISSFVVFMINAMAFDVEGVSDTWRSEFIPTQWPWIVALLIQALMLASKSKKEDK